MLHLPQTTRIINRHGVARGQTLCQEAVQLNLILILNEGLARGIRHNRHNTRAVNPWPRLASHGTPPCATRGVDMLSRWEHAQRPGGTREKSLSDDPPEPRTSNRQTKGQKEPQRCGIWCGRSAPSCLQAWLELGLRLGLEQMWLQRRVAPAGVRVS